MPAREIASGNLNGAANSILSHKVIPAVASTIVEVCFKFGYVPRALNATAVCGSSKYLHIT